MDGAEHPPRTNAPDTEDALGPDALVRDAEGGAVRSADAWIVEKMRAERRSRDECLEALVNAIARGDVVVVER